MTARSGAEAAERSERRQAAALAARDRDQAERDAVERAVPNPAPHTDAGPVGDGISCLHEDLERNGTSRRTPIRCRACGTQLDVAALAALVIRWVEEDRDEIAGLRSRVAALEASLVAPS